MLRYRRTGLYYCFNKIQFNRTGGKLQWIQIKNEKRKSKNSKWKKQPEGPR